MAGGNNALGFLPVAAAIAATVATDGAAAPMIGEAMGAEGTAATILGSGVMGAGVGGLQSALTGGNVGQGLLYGGLGGAAMGGLGSMMGGTGLTGVEGTPTEMVSPMASGSTEGAQLMGGNVPMTGADFEQLPSQMPVNNTLANSPNAPTSGYGGGYSSNPNMVNPTATTAYNPGGGGLMSGLSNLSTTQKLMLGTAGLGALSYLSGQGQGGAAPGSTGTYKGALSKFSYDPNTYQPDIVRPPSPLYQARYAQGGIAAMATGGLGDNTMFPQSQQDPTQFATSSQYPAQAVAADYDTKTNPLTGEEIPQMAKGGTPPVTQQTTPASSMAKVDEYINTYKTVEGGAKQVMDAARNDDPAAIAALARIQQEQQLTAAMAQQQQAAQQVQGRSPLTQGLGVINAAAGGTMYAAGGISDLGSYSDGGRLLKGPGDGMSDNIPAKIGHSQPARLAEGEFVVPADVVSHLGNGSTDAGAKKLYSMMDKVRTARTGRKAQGKEINADKYLPA